MTATNRDNTAKIANLREVPTVRPYGPGEPGVEDGAFTGDESGKGTTPGGDRTEDTGEVSKSARRSLRRLVLPIVGLAVLAGGAWWGHDWWTVGRFMVQTDDAYIKGDITTLAPKVSGYVATVNVTANERVKTGDPLVTLDGGDYRIAAEIARSKLATQGFTLKRIDAQIMGAEAALDQAKADRTAQQAAVDIAQKAYGRSKQLHQSDFGSQAALDGAIAALDQAKAGLAGADAGIAAAQAQVSVLKAQHAETQSQVRSLQLALDMAERDLGFTVLRAPYDGVVGNIAVQKGDLVSPGQRLAALVPVNDLYIEANFKETQIARLTPGETVDVHVDAYGAKPIKGTVVSLSPASGSVFSLLPADNATGNFTKVVQRVPVRIALPKAALESGRLRAGLSVMVDVDSRTAPLGARTAELASAK